MLRSNRLWGLVRQPMYCIHYYRSSPAQQRWFTVGSSPCLRRKSATKKSSPLDLVRLLPSLRNTRSEAWASRMLSAQLNEFPHNGFIRRRAASMGVKGKLFKELAERFANQATLGAVAGCNPKALLAALAPPDNSDVKVAIEQFLFSKFMDFAEPHLPEDIQESYRSLKQLCDLRFPSEWFPEARQMQRQIYMHVGPTNSGKTYRALKRLEEAESGIYCGPLRLLAHEIFEKMNAKGVPCNLLTGEVRYEVSPDAPLTSSTVEMANLTRPMEVAVIDEIQLISDPLRGWAWTQALLGLQAKEIHLCGEPSAVPLIQKICESLDEKLIVNEYERLTPVKVADYSLRDWKDIQKGDCVVAFSRTDIFECKKKIEAETGLKCAVVYGALPPETRALQAKTFNDPNSDVDVLVASDAVGMGLNLNIKRIVFSTVQKFDGQTKRFISIPQLKQIGGRAGRFGTAYASGQVTALSPLDLSYVKQAMSAPIEPLLLAGLQPTVDIIELFALQMPKARFSRLLQIFEDLASLDGNYFLCNFKDLKIIAELIEDLPMPIRDRYKFVTAPVNTRNKDLLKAFVSMAKSFSNNEECPLDSLVVLPERKLQANNEVLRMLETCHKTIMLYMWLSLRFPETFSTPQEEALELKSRCEVLIDETLRHLVPKKKKKLSAPRIKE